MSSGHIGLRIREVRKIRQMTVRQLAGKIRVSVSTLEKYESGDRNPPPGVVAQIARALRVGPDRLTGQPYWNGAETAEQVQAVIPELRRVLLTYDNPDDLLVEPRPLPVLAAEMDHIAQMRQDGQYVPMGPLLPGLLAELTHVALTARGRDQEQAYWWLARGYRATNSLAHKLGYHDLSLTAIERVRWAAQRSGDNLMMVTAAYLKAGAMVRMGTYASARRVLEALVDEVERLAPEASMSDAQIAIQGAVLLKLAILEARDGHPDRATDRLAEARAAAGMLRADTTHYEMSFGPTNVRIHEVAALIDTGDTEQALARLREWGAEQDRDEWQLPAGIVAERASHHHIDVAAARLAEGDRAGAHRDLLEARRLSPNHSRFHPTVRNTAATLVRLDRSQDDALVGFAKWAGV
ncbi:helix-turn-helix transcriptional regulator [Streptomyces sp. CC208A]|uniref:helix-turn-helix domain-containing protein n=1 Tax=Streptomyces sp. CC208A TaxID=3044573 RepID=UPI0024A88B3C|nr:helix-turn-helix transcriptional regulator [Streptomyces sp. CC208A]